MTRKAVPKPKAQSFDEKLATLADHLIKRVLQPENDIPPTVAEETAAFKAISSYLQMVHKGRPPEDEPTMFKDWQRTLEEAEDGEDQVHGVAGSAGDGDVGHDGPGRGVANGRARA